ncbi:unnamed protein product [Polarella glacialis]|uniref:Uncharacterized protein n=1 Tax=Polarella glacialis TaxID=89957 RepID=A0A813DFC4_POLGL|nr:unnamed protein product [Polarella glacialis]CAE8737301.1 unnamed protein product [Polarella glacialis]
MQAPTKWQADRRDIPRLLSNNNNDHNDEKNNISYFHNGSTIMRDFRRSPGRSQQRHHCLRSRGQARRRHRALAKQSFCSLLL